MYVRAFESLESLESHREQWDALANDGVFRSWTWLTTWWRHFGASTDSRRLYVVAAFHDVGQHGGRMAAVLPCYIESSWSRGRMLRLLGDGAACSDHAGLLGDAAHGAEAAETIAEYVALDDGWDVLDFHAIDADDRLTLAFRDGLHRREFAVATLPGEQTWSIDLPTTWDEFLDMQSKSHRKQLRQAERRVLASGGARWTLVTTADEFDAAWNVLIDLHQRRRQSLGEPGCFASPTWSAFHRDVARQLLAAGRLWLSTLTLGGVPAAAEYHFAGRRATYAYQGGVDPDRLAEEPGRLSTICALQQAIAEGHRQFDFLRGDESYKAHWRAQPRAAVRIVAVPPRSWPRLRHNAWQGVRDATHFVKQLAGRR